MKTIKILLVSAVIFGNFCVSSVNASNKSVKQSYHIEQFGSQVINDTRVNEIIGMVGSSINLKGLEKDGFVVLEYHIGTNGSVYVDQLNTNNNLLGTQVKTQVENLLLLTSSNTNKEYYAKFTFIKKQKLIVNRSKKKKQLNRLNY